MLLGIVVVAVGRTSGLSMDRNIDFNRVITVGIRTLEVCGCVRVVVVGVAVWRNDVRYQCRNSC